MSWPDPTQIPNLTPHQRSELFNAFQDSVGILTGCPGAGKTWTLAKVLHEILEYGDGQASVAVCAYTGKAAVRATESLKDSGLNIAATTIHRLLKPMMADDGTFTFVHNRDNPLNLEYLIVDEASMLGMNIGSSLLKALPTGIHLLFVGDHHQLPPVEKGALLRDFILSGLPHGDLKEIFRNSGQIVQCCKNIREGKAFIPSANPSYGAGPEHNLRHIETKNNDESADKLLEVVSSIKLNPEIDIKWSVQALVFVNEKSELSRKALNGKLKELLNHGAATVVERYAVGDKVICLKNHLYEWTDSLGYPKAEFVANGQMGQIVDHQGNAVTVLLKNSDEDPGTPVSVSKQLLLEEWDLGYAISIHKSQGSSWPIVIVMIDHSNSARFMASRQLVYTALSRAEKYCITIGQRRDIFEACKRDSMKERITGIVEAFKEGDNDEGEIWT